MPAKTTTRTCPSCNALVLPGRNVCMRCGLDFTKLDAAGEAEIRAERAARQQAAETGLTLRDLLPYAITGLVIAVLLVAAIVLYRVLFPPIDPIAHYPTDRVAVARQFMELAARDTLKDAEAAYKLVSLSRKDLGNDAEPGLWQQMFHEMDGYLAGEFGREWPKDMRLEIAPDAANTVLVHVGTETLTLNLERQIRPDKEGKFNFDAITTPYPANPDDGTVRWGVAQIAEFPFNEATQAQSLAAQRNLIGGVAGAGALQNLDTIINHYGGGPRETRMRMKRRLLPALRNPDFPALPDCVYQCYPLRNDPTVHRRLEKILNDGAYQEHIHTAVKAVLEGRVDETDLTMHNVKYPTDAAP